MTREEVLTFWKEIDQVCEKHDVRLMQGQGAWPSIFIVGRDFTGIKAAIMVDPDTGEATID